MNNDLESFLQTIKGNWISQKTTYYMHNNNLDMYTSENIISVQKELHNIGKNEISQYYYLKNRDIKTNKETSHIFIINKKNIDFKIINGAISYDGKFTLHSNNYINKIFIYQNIHYDEYNYIITPKFLLSIGIVKKNNNYIAITFTSHIKKIID